MKKMLLAAVAALALSGCAYQLTAMPRDSGKVYYGEATSNGMGSGPISLTIEERTYTGRWVVATRDDSFTILNTYGKNSRGGVATGTGFAQTYGGGGTLKAMLSSADGKGMRCELSGTSSGTGGGVCMDDAGRVFDIQYSR
jgi:hypothetical protein